MEIFILDLSLSVQFLCWPWPILPEMLTAHIGARLSLGNLLFFRAGGDPLVDIVKIRRAKLSYWGCPMENVPKGCIWKTQSTNYVSGLENFNQSLSSFLISLVVPLLLRFWLWSFLDFLKVRGRKWIICQWFVLCV